MKRYIMQVRIEHRDGSIDWMPVKPKGGEPYKYETREEAERMVRICYPDQHRLGETRVVEVEE